MTPREQQQLAATTSPDAVQVLTTQIRVLCKQLAELERAEQRRVSRLPRQQEGPIVQIPGSMAATPAPMQVLPAATGVAPAAALATSLPAAPAMQLVPAAAFQAPAPAPAVFLPPPAFPQIFTLHKAGDMLNKEAVGLPNYAGRRWFI